MYRVLISERAERDIKALPADVIEKIDEKIRELSLDPWSLGCRKIKGTSDGWRMKVRRNYRILYTVDKRKKEIRIFRIVRREKDIYK